jgi:hypothetical protein
MEITQTYPADYLGKQTLIAMDDKFIVQYKNLIREFTVEYSYAEFGPKFIKGKDSDSAWTTLGWNLLFVMIISYVVASFIFPGITQSLPFALILVVLLIGSLISHFMRFVKQDTVSFYDKQKDYICQIKLTNKNRQAAQGMVDFIIERVQQQAQKNETAS